MTDSSRLVLLPSIIDSCKRLGSSRIGSSIFHNKTSFRYVSKVWNYISKSNLLFRMKHSNNLYSFCSDLNRIGADVHTNQYNTHLIHWIKTNFWSSVSRQKAILSQGLYRKLSKQSPLLHYLWWLNIKHRGKQKLWGKAEHPGQETNQWLLAAVVAAAVAAPLWEPLGFQSL